MSKPLLVVVTGPTAVGKTDLCIELAEKFNTEIISADSRQIYKELNIGVAKPTDLDLSRVKHHFINHISIQDHYNAGLFEVQSNQILNQLFEKERIVLLTGGTGLYIKSCIEGLDSLPEKNTALRNQLGSIYQVQGIEALQSRLLALDSTAKLENMENPHRLIRAIEIVVSTKKSLAESLSNAHSDRPYTIATYYLNRPREELYQRINRRVDRMMEIGLENEVKALEQHKNLQALNTVGYKELFDYYAGIITRDEAVEKIKQHTRNYAKRQLTWFRNQGNFKEVLDFESLFDEIEEKIS